MGFLSNLGNSVVNAAKEGLRGGIIDGFLNGMGISAFNEQVRYSDYIYDANGNIKGINKEAVRDISNTYQGTNTNFYNEDKKQRKYSSNPGLANVTGTIANGLGENSIRQDIDKYSEYSSAASLLKKRSSSDYEGYDDLKGPKKTYSDISQLRIPNWGYDDFINERAIWAKQIGNAFNEPAWFYFKIFFDFDTNHGLFGSLLNKEDPIYGENCAARYLMSCQSMYHDEEVGDRITALYKFTSILSYITSNAPWFFKSVKGLDKLSIPSLTDFSKEKSIEIELMPDAVDMRLTTLMSLYKYACFDDYNHKEVIPQNLRQFNMSVVIFQSPLRYLHTSYTSQKNVNFLGLDSNKLGLSNILGNNSGTKKYKKLWDNDFNDMMSFKIYTLYGCEFDMESLASIMTGEATNESPFQLGNTSIKITYSSSIEHSMNEFYQIMYGSNGFFFNNYANYQTGFNTYKNTKSAINKQKERYQALIDTFGTPGTGGTILGMINSPKTYQHAVDASEALLNGMFNDNDLLGDLGANFTLGLLGSSKNAYAPQGNIYGDVGIGSAYFKDKLEMLKNGIHENTMPPYYYDPERGIVYERGKPANEYSAYSYYNMKTDINNFDLGNWLNTGTTSLGISVNDNIRNLISPKANELVVPGTKNQYLKEPFGYDAANAIQYEQSKPAHPLRDDATNPDLSPSLDRYAKNIQSYTNRNYLNDGEGTDKKHLEKTETKKPYNPYETIKNHINNIKKQ